MLLTGYRILDLADEWGMLAGKMLADLGAEVIAVEPPAGNPARRLGPFFHDEPSHSLFWIAYAAGKKGITLDLETADGQELFRGLVGLSDAVVETFPPGYLARQGLDYPALRRENPSLVLCSVTPYGQDGPYAGWLGTDLTITAAGGLAYVTGDPDRPPLRFSFPQAPQVTACAAAAGVMLALFHRTRTGQGQQVDCSAQHAIARTLDRAPIFWDFAEMVLKRTGFYGRPGGGTLRRMIWPCGDGYVSYLLVGGATGARSMKAIIRWMDDAHFDSEGLKRISWDEVDFTSIPQEVLDTASEALVRFFADMSREEIWRQSRQRRLLLYPVSTPGEVYQHAHEMYPGFFQPVEHPELRATLEYPGPFLTIPEGDQRTAKAPSLGEHNRKVYGGLLGLSVGELRALRQGGVI